MTYFTARSSLGREDAQKIHKELLQSKGSITLGHLLEIVELWPGKFLSCVSQLVVVGRVVARAYPTDLVEHRLMAKLESACSGTKRHSNHSVALAARDFRKLQGLALA